MTIFKAHFLQPLRGRDRLGRVFRATLSVGHVAIRRDLQCRAEDPPSPPSYSPGSECWARRHSKSFPVAVAESARES